MITGSRLDRINCDILTPIVQRALGDPKLVNQPWIGPLSGSGWPLVTLVYCRERSWLVSYYLTIPGWTQAADCAICLHSSFGIALELQSSLFAERRDLKPTAL
jgi:hypothetical protein